MSYHPGKLKTALGKYRINAVISVVHRKQERVDTKIEASPPKYSLWGQKALSSCVKISTVVSDSILCRYVCILDRLFRKLGVPY